MVRMYAFSACMAMCLCTLAHVSMHVYLSVCLFPYVHGTSMYVCVSCHMWVHVRMCMVFVCVHTCVCKSTYSYVLMRKYIAKCAYLLITNNKSLVIQSEIHYTVTYFPILQY